MPINEMDQVEPIRKIRRDVEFLLNRSAEAMSPAVLQYFQAASGLDKLSSGKMDELHKLHHALASSIKENPQQRGCPEESAGAAFQDLDNDKLGAVSGAILMRLKSIPRLTPLRIKCKTMTEGINKCMSTWREEFGSQ